MTTNRHVAIKNGKIGMTMNAVNCPMCLQQLSSIAIATFSSLWSDEDVSEVEWLVFQVRLKMLQKLDNVA